MKAKSIEIKALTLKTLFSVVLNNDKTVPTLVNKTLNDYLQGNPVAENNIDTAIAILKLPQDLNVSQKNQLASETAIKKVAVKLSYLIHEFNVLLEDDTLQVSKTTNLPIYLTNEDNNVIVNELITEIKDLTLKNLDDLLYANMLYKYVIYMLCPNQLKFLSSGKNLQSTNNTRISSHTISLQSLINSKTNSVDKELVYNLLTFQEILLNNLMLNKASAFKNISEVNKRTVINLVDWEPKSINEVVKVVFNIKTMLETISS